MALLVSKAQTSQGSSHVAEPANFSLNVIYPRPVGTAPDLDSSNRCFFAYPGITYRLYATAIGGSYPFTWSLSNAPSGMSINSSTGLITWTNPQSSASNITVTCTDALGTEDSQIWSITVSATDWLFVDAVNGNDSTGDGSISSPWQTIQGVFDNDYQGSRVYFRDGIYNLDGLTTTSSGNALRCEFEYNGSAGRGHAQVWIAYPGETPEIDFQYSGNPATYVPYIFFIGPNIYMEGFECYGDKIKCFQFAGISRHGFYACDLNFHTGGPGADGSNAGFIMTSSSYGSGAYGCVFRFNTYGDASHNAIKAYSMHYSSYSDSTYGAGQGGIELKADMSNFDLTNNTFLELDGDAFAGIGGNLDANTGSTCTGEIRFNRLKTAGGSTIQIGNGKISPIGPIYLVRNTFEGTVEVRNLATADGPYTFRHNVKVNEDSAETPWPHIVDTTISDSSRVTITDDLNGVAADGIVDANGLLQGSYRTTYLGTRGHEVP